MIPSITRRAFPAFVILLPVWHACLGLANAATPVLTISKSPGSNVTISWFGEAGVSYQLQSSTTLDPGAWADHGIAITGADATVNVPFSITGKPKVFFRIEPPPADVITAVFSAGVLTVTGGDRTMRSPSAAMPREICG